MRLQPPCSCDEGDWRWPRRGGGVLSRPGLGWKSNTQVAKTRASHFTTGDLGLTVLHLKALAEQTAFLESNLVVLYLGKYTHFQWPHNSTAVHSPREPLRQEHNTYRGMFVVAVPTPAKGWESPVAIKREFEK